MIKPQSVAKFMDGDAVKIKDRRRKCTAIGVPRDRLVKDGVGFFEITVAITEHGHRQRAAAKIAAENLGIECDRHFIVPFHRSDGGVFHPGKLELGKMRARGFEGSSSRAGKGGGPVSRWRVR